MLGLNLNKGRVLRGGGGGGVAWTFSYLFSNHEDDIQS